MTSQIVRVLCFSLFLFFSADGFIASHDVNRNRQTTLCMGGYYAEPDAPQSTTGTTATGKGTGTRSRQQHMIFGIPCIEESFVFHSSLKITNLSPDNQQSDHDNEQHDCLQMYTTQHLLRYLQANINFKDKSVVEVGASAVSIAAAVAFEAAAVTLYHPDAELLRIWEHSLRYFNAPSSCTITTKTLDPLLHPFEFDCLLPPADILLITLTSLIQHRDGNTLQTIVEQASQNGSRIIMMVPEHKNILLQQDWIDAIKGDGILDILPVSNIR